MKNFTLLVIVLFVFKYLPAQNSKTIIPTIWEGMAIAGYVNDGGFVNFGGPGIKFGHKPYSILVTMLPSLRLKDDRVAEGQAKNTFITPSLGTGITLSYHHLAIQVPVYYNTKTTAKDGKWNLGLGIGYKF